MSTSTTALGAFYVGAALAASPPPPDMPLWVVPFLGGLAILSGLVHWQFTSGPRLVSGRLNPGPTMFDTMVRLHFTALPNGIFCALWCVGYAAMSWSIAHENWQVAVLGIGLVTVGAGFAVWGFKEFVRPSRRRIPDWLREIPRIEGVWLPSR